MVQILPVSSKPRLSGKLGEPLQLQPKQAFTPKIEENVMFGSVVEPKKKSNYIYIVAIIAVVFILFKK